jgi:hypothetical protein
MLLSRHLYHGRVSSLSTTLGIKDQKYETELGSRQGCLLAVSTLQQEVSCYRKPVTRNSTLQQEAHRR